MKKLLTLVLALALMMSAFAFAEANVSVTGKVTEIEKYGHALLDVTIEDFTNLGFTLGDVVTVKAGTYEGDMPYYNGYYVNKGEYMVRAYPGHTNIAVCINYGKFAETAGIGIGDEVTITLKVKGGELFTQEMSSLVYTNEPADYKDEATFANFREVKVTGIAAGKLFRSASPINNENNRAAITNKLVEAAGIKSVMNMADTAEEIAEYAAAEDFASEYYKKLYDEGNVIVLAMPVNFASAEFASGIVNGLTFLSQKEAPYLVHCTEGKDRAGFASMLIEALMGATMDEIIADYMMSYENYYGVDAAEETEKYNMIVEKNAIEMLKVIAGVEDAAALETADLAQGAWNYLLNNGMAQEAIDALKANLK
ncbi:MAG: tyrosine-protein phosphatase [Clostridia bacterium]|nr:tyrosine-protein phosphatase [Clostridia bacterium]